MPINLKTVYPALQPRTTFNPETIANHIAHFEQLGLSDTLVQERDIGNSAREKMTALIVCPGPSACEVPQGGTKTRLELLTDESGIHRSYLVLAGAAHRFLNDGTLKRADAIVFNNPESAYESVITDPGTGASFVHPYMSYLVATHCTPRTFEVLQANGAVIEPWQAYIEGVPLPEKNKIAIGTASGAGTGAIALMSALGHRKFEMIGFDGTSDYAVDISDMPKYIKELEENQVAVELDGRVYSLHTDFWNQTLELVQFMQDYPNAIAQIHFHGDTLNAAIFNTPDGRPRTDFKLLNGGGAAVVPGDKIGDPAP